MKKAYLRCLDCGCVIMGLENRMDGMNCPLCKGIAVPLEQAKREYECQTCHATVFDQPIRHDRNMNDICQYCGGVKVLTDKSIPLRQALDELKERRKPPLGIEPRWMHDAERHVELGEAINRYIKAAKPILTEWVEEYNEISKKYSNERWKLLPTPTNLMF